MCGILGLVSVGGGSMPDAEVVSRMLESIVHRGPDDEGVYIEEGVVLAMRRLSIIDVHGGHQPLSDASGSTWVVCNGEIYNFRQLRSELQDRGYRFKTGSDCEVLLHLYAEYGDAFIHKLNGMFAFALWDKTRKRLVLGRDRLGIKPLYYLSRGGNLVFASEIKALLQAPGVSVTVDYAAVEAYLAFGYVPAPLTLIQGVRKLPPASILVVEGGRLDLRHYWQVPQTVHRGRCMEEWSFLVRAHVERAVQSQMVADVPIGAFLSGGIDSSAVVAFMARQTAQPVKTYSIGFSGGGPETLYNELPYARDIAKRFGTDHHEIMVTPDVVRLLPKLIWHMDEPIADSAMITTNLVSEFARHEVKVILSGVGGDELFGGYRRYLGEYYGGLYRRFPIWFRKQVLQPLARRLPSDRHSKLLNTSRLMRTFLLSAELSTAERYRSYVEVFGDESLRTILSSATTASHDALTTAFMETTADDPLLRLLIVDLRTQLPDDLLLLTDKMTMAASLECRVPLLDHELVELAAQVPAKYRIHGTQTKYLFKRALVGVLPARILNRPKRGFGAPVGAWMKRQLAPVMHSVLSEESVRRRGFFQWDAVQKTLQAHHSNKADHTDHLSALMNFEIWCRLFLDGKSHEEVAAGLIEGNASGDPVHLPSLSVST